jgi:ApaG protein
MVAEVTHGIKVSVDTKYAEGHSNPDLHYFLFSYKIKIENNSEFAVQLISRHWHIFDSAAGLREVEGEGVIGQQPTIAPGDFFEYESACDLTSDIGSMRGTYTMHRNMDNKVFEIKIPRFELVVPRRLN